MQEPLPRFLQRPSEPPSIDAPFKPRSPEGIYDRFLDNPAASTKGIKPYAPSTLEKLTRPPPALQPPKPEVAPVGPPPAPERGVFEPAPEPFIPPKKGGGGGPPPASGAPAPPATPPRHPKGAKDVRGNKIGGRFIGDYS